MGSGRSKVTIPPDSTLPSVCNHPTILERLSRMYPAMISVESNSHKRCRNTSSCRVLRVLRVSIKGLDQGEPVLSCTCAMLQLCCRHLRRKTSTAFWAGAMRGWNARDHSAQSKTGAEPGGGTGLSAVVGSTSLARGTPDRPSSSEASRGEGIQLP